MILEDLAELLEMSGWGTIFFLSIPLIADIFKKFKSYDIKNKIFNIFFVLINSYYNFNRR